MRAEEALLEGVQRTRSDVAVDDAERRQRKREQALRMDLIGHEGLQVPTGLADGLEVGSPLPAECWMRPWRLVVSDRRWFPRIALAERNTVMAFLRAN